MDNCIFSPHCTELICDKSCPSFTEMSYLLERNKINMNSHVFHMSNETVSKAMSILDKSSGSLKVIDAKNDTSEVAKILTYCSICDHWQGSRLHCIVYNLKFSSYIEAIQKSWSSPSSSDSLEYETIWSQSAKVLIISGIDFVQFKDFQSQSLLNMIQGRKEEGLTTIIVSPGLDKLIGSGPFFNRMRQLLDQKGTVIRW